MYWTGILIWALMLKYSSQQCLSEDDTLPLETRTEDNIKTISNAASKFTFQLFTAMAAMANAITDNFLISPISVWSILVTTLLGARGNTASQLETALHVIQGVNRQHLLTAFLEFRDVVLHDGNDKANYTFNLANKLFFDSNIPIRECIGETRLNAELQSLDFVNNSEESRQTMNHWAANMTNNRIQDLIQKGAVDQTTSILLVNAVYFKGIWKEKFTTSFVDDVFFIRPGQPVKVTMMSVLGRFRVGYDATLDCSAVELPYSDGDVSMIILRPNISVEHIISKLTFENINNLYNSLDTYDITVEVPKFKIEQTTDLKEYIQKLGIRDTIQPEIADFSGFTGDKKSYADIVRHKAYIDVNEKGTEAGAAGQGTIYISGTISKRDPFVCDTPFIYFIRHNKAGTILFGGVLRKPEYN